MRHLGNGIVPAPPVDGAINMVCDLASGFDAGPRTILTGTVHEILMPPAGNLAIYVDHRFATRRDQEASDGCMGT